MARKVDTLPTEARLEVLTDEDLRSDASERHLIALREMHLTALALQGDIDRQVAQLRMEGVSWARIALAFGVSPQAAHQRWSPDGVEKHRVRQRRLAEGATGEPAL